MSIDSFIDRLFWRYIVLTTDSHDNKLYKQQIVCIIVSPICCWLLRLASKEPEYAVFVRAFLFGGQPTFARLERKIQPYKKIKLEWKRPWQIEEKSPAVEIFRSISRTWPCKKVKATAISLPDRLRLQGLCIRLFIKCKQTFYLSVWPTVGRLLLSLSSTIVPVSSV